MASCCRSDQRLRQPDLGLGGGQVHRIGEHPEYHPGVVVAAVECKVQPGTYRAGGWVGGQAGQGVLEAFNGALKSESHLGYVERADVDTDVKVGVAGGGDTKGAERVQSVDG